MKEVMKKTLIPDDVARKFLATRNKGKLCNVIEYECSASLNL